MHVTRRAAYGAVVMIVGAWWGMSTVHAAPPSDDAAIAAIKGQNPGSDVSGFHRVYAGPLGAHTDGVTIATYTLELSNGGNFSASSFGAFVERNGRTIQLANQPEPTGQVRAVAVRGGRLVVTWMAFRPSDPHCCPSDRHTVGYAVGQNAMTAAR